ncbi:hypothetical protein ACFE04_030504 [Oxalis oulophora]
MGKYIPKKPKTSKEVISSSSSGGSGVRTRAKTLALQRLNSSINISSKPNPNNNNNNNNSGDGDGSLCYLELRSRRLEKPSFDFNRKGLNNQRNKEEGHFGQFDKIGEIEGVNVNNKGLSEDGIIGIDEASCGDNNFEDRTTRESTPCSLIKDVNSIGTPGSTTKQTSPATNYRRAQDGVQRNIPTSLEMDAFFSSMERENQRLFIEKYNFDIVNDLPLPGHYEWTKVTP